MTIKEMRCVKCDAGQRAEFIVCFFVSNNDKDEEVHNRQPGTWLKDNTIMSQLMDPNI